MDEQHKQQIMMAVVVGGFAFIVGKVLSFVVTADSFWEAATQFFPSLYVAIPVGLIAGGATYGILRMTQK